MPEAAGHSCDPLLSPIVDHCPGHRMILRPRSGAAGTVLRENALGGRGSAVPTDKILAESQGVARPSSASNSVGEALGLRQSQIIVEPLIGPLSNSHPAPIILDGSKGLVSASPPAVPDRLIGSPGDDVAFADSASDDLDHWSGSDTAYGWGVPVDPGFVELEANKAGPVQPGSSSALGALLPVTADTADIPAAHVQVNCLYVGASVAPSTELTYKAAMLPTNPDRDQWLLAMKDEMASLHAHGTWVLTPQPRKQKILSGRWLFVKKIGVDGSIRFKARFVVRGFLQRPGLDFHDVYAPVSSKAGLRVLLAAITHRKMFVRQLDIKTAFLNAKLEPGLDLYCRQPEGFQHLGPNGVPLVCKLLKSLYGLKQAPRAWSRDVKRVLVAHGFTMCKAEPALYFRKDSDGGWSYVLTYVDDFICAFSELDRYVLLIQAMEKAGWEVKEMGVPVQFLSLDMHVTLDSEGRCVQINISQHTYIVDLVEQFGLTDAAPPRFAAPMAKSTVSDAPGEPLPSNSQYLSLVGALLYLATCTRPDISFAVSYLSRFSAHPTVPLWGAAKRLLLSLRTHSHLGLTYTHNPEFSFTVFSDSSFADDGSDRRSQTGFAVLAGGCIVNWMSKRQPTVAISSSEAEYQALSQAAREVQWLKKLRVDLGLPCALVTIQGDNLGSLSWAKDWQLLPRSKHIDVIHHYIKELVEDGSLDVAYVNTVDNCADPFTKPLDPAVFWRFVRMLVSDSRVWILNPMSEAATAAENGETFFYHGSVGTPYKGCPTHPTSRPTWDPKAFTAPIDFMMDLLRYFPHLRRETPFAMSAIRFSHTNWAYVYVILLMHMVEHSFSLDEYKYEVNRDGSLYSGCADTLYGELDGVENWTSIHTWGKEQGLPIRVSISKQKPGTLIAPTACPQDIPSLHLTHYLTVPRGGIYPAPDASLRVLPTTRVNPPARAQEEIHLLAADRDMARYHQNPAKPQQQLTPGTLYGEDVNPVNVYDLLPMPEPLNAETHPTRPPLSFEPSDRFFTVEEEERCCNQTRCTRLCGTPDISIHPSSIFVITPSALHQALPDIQPQYPDDWGNNNNSDEEVSMEQKTTDTDEAEDGAFLMQAHA
eukprot:gene29094-biopygen32958